MQQHQIKKEIKKVLHEINEEFFSMEKMFLNHEGIPEVKIDPFLKIKKGVTMHFAEGVKGERLDTTSGYLFRGYYRKGCKLDAHFHSFTEIVTIKKGRLWDFIGGKYYEEGGTYLLPPLTPHGIDVLEDTESIIRFVEYEIK